MSYLAANRDTLRALARASFKRADDLSEMSLEAIAYDAKRDARANCRLLTSLSLMFEHAASDLDAQIQAAVTQPAPPSE